MKIKLMPRHHRRAHALQYLLYCFLKLEVAAVKAALQEASSIDKDLLHRNQRLLAEARAARDREMVHLPLHKLKQELQACKDAVRSMEEAIQVTGMLWRRDGKWLYIVNVSLTLNPHVTVVARY
jgi:hypothetical protein